MRFQRQVYSGEYADYAPDVMFVDIDEKRANQIRQMAAILREHKGGPLQLYTITAWDCSGDWFKPCPDESNENRIACAECDNGYMELMPAEGLGYPHLQCSKCGVSIEHERMECEEIVVTDDDFYYRALVKHCDDWCESERIEFHELPGANVCAVCGVDETVQTHREAMHHETQTA